jgi:hypothetical protein
VELDVVSLTQSSGLALRLQSPVAQLLPLHEPEKEFKDCSAGASKCDERKEEVGYKLNK